jgi:hypothetical protein
MSTIPEVSGRLREMKLKARPATTAAALAMGLLFTAEVKADELSRFTHGPLSWELGGWAGRGHRSHLPPRPYLKPAAERLIANGSITKAAVRGWLAVMGL